MAMYIQSKYQNSVTGEVTTDLSGPFSNSINAESALCSLLNKEGIISAQIVEAGPAKKEQKNPNGPPPPCNGNYIDPDLENPAMSMRHRQTPADTIAKLRSEID
jgi:hypothetical protein